MKLYAGIDLGTSGTKTVLFDKYGNAVASAYREYPLYQPQNGYAEQEPDDWWQAVKDTLKEVSEKAKDCKIAGIGISGQMHGLVMLDKNGIVLRRSIIWCDQRTTKECKELENAVGRKRLLELTGSPALTGFTASKILWVKNNEPHIFKKCEHILLPKDYIRYMLCGVFATEVSDASGMQIFDVKKRDFSDELIRAVGIKKEMLGKVYESHEITGYVTEEASRLINIPVGTPVVGGAGDNAAAAIGTATVKNGDCFTTIGTSGVVFCHTENFTADISGRAHAFCAAVDSEWHIMGVTQSAGLSLNWLKNTCCGYSAEKAKSVGIPAYKYLDELAEKSGIGANRLLFLPYLMGERTPHLDPNARGVFFGFSAIHTEGDLVRAVLEGVGFSLLDAINTLRDSGAFINGMTVCGGGAKSSVWCKILADIFGMDVRTLSVTEGPALGVAILSMIKTGEYDSVKSAVKEIIKPDKTYKYSPDNHKKYQKIYALYRDLYRHLKDDFTTLSKL